MGFETFISHKRNQVTHAPADRGWNLLWSFIVKTDPTIPKLGGRSHFANTGALRSIDKNITN